MQPALTMRCLAQEFARLHHRNREAGCDANGAARESNAGKTSSPLLY